MESNILKTAQDFISAQASVSQTEGNGKIMDFLKNRFASDTRYKEVSNFLNSSRELIIKMEHIHNKESLTEEQLTVER